MSTCALLKEWGKTHHVVWGFGTTFGEVFGIDEQESVWKMLVEKHGLRVVLFCAQKKLRPRTSEGDGASVKKKPTKKAASVGPPEPDQTGVGRAYVNVDGKLEMVACVVQKAPGLLGSPQIRLQVGQTDGGDWTSGNGPGVVVVYIDVSECVWYGSVGVKAAIATPPSWWVRGFLRLERKPLSDEIKRLNKWMKSQDVFVDCLAECTTLGMAASIDVFVGALIFEPSPREWFGTAMQIGYYLARRGDVRRPVFVVDTRTDAWVTHVVTGDARDYGKAGLTMDFKQRVVGVWVIPLGSTVYGVEIGSENGVDFRADMVRKIINNRPPKTPLRWGNVVAMAFNPRIPEVARGGLALSRTGVSIGTGMLKFGGIPRVEEAAGLPEWTTEFDVAGHAGFDDEGRSLVAERRTRAKDRVSLERVHRLLEGDDGGRLEKHDGPDKEAFEIRWGAFASKVTLAAKEASAQAAQAAADAETQRAYDAGIVGYEDAMAKVRSDYKDAIAGLRDVYRAGLDKLMQTYGRDNGKELYEVVKARRGRSSGTTVASTEEKRTSTNLLGRPGLWMPPRETTAKPWRAVDVAREYLKSEVARLDEALKTGRDAANAACQASEANVVLGCRKWSTGLVGSENAGADRLGVVKRTQAKCAEWTQAGDAYRAEMAGSKGELTGMQRAFLATGVLEMIEAAERVETRESLTVRTAARPEPVTAANAPTSAHDDDGVVIINIQSGYTKVVTNSEGGAAGSGSGFVADATRQSVLVVAPGDGAILGVVAPVLPAPAPAARATITADPTVQPPISLAYAGTAALLPGPASVAFMPVVLTAAQRPAPADAVSSGEAPMTGLVAADDIEPRVEVMASEAQAASSVPMVAARAETAVLGWLEKVNGASTGQAEALALWDMIPERERIAGWFDGGLNGSVYDAQALRAKVHEKWSGLFAKFCLGVELSENLVWLRDYFRYDDASQELNAYYEKRSAETGSGGTHIMTVKVLGERRKLMRLLDAGKFEGIGRRFTRDELLDCFVRLIDTDAAQLERVLGSAFDVSLKRMAAHFEYYYEWIKERLRMELSLLNFGRLTSVFISYAELASGPEGADVLRALPSPMPTGAAGSTGLAVAVVADAEAARVARVAAADVAAEKKAVDDAEVLKEATLWYEMREKYGERPGKYREQVWSTMVDDHKTQERYAADYEALMKEKGKKPGSELTRRTGLNEEMWAEAQQRADADVAAQKKMREDARWRAEEYAKDRALRIAAIVRDELSDGGEHVSYAKKMESRSQALSLRADRIIVKMSDAEKHRFYEKRVRALEKVRPKSTEAEYAREYAKLRTVFEAGQRELAKLGVRVYGGVAAEAKSDELCRQLFDGVLVDAAAVVGALGMGSIAAPGRRWSRWQDALVPAEGWLRVTQTGDVLNEFGIERNVELKRAVLVYTCIIGADVLVRREDFTRVHKIRTVDGAALRGDLMPQYVPTSMARGLRQPKGLLALEAAPQGRTPAAVTALHPPPQDGPAPVWDPKAPVPSSIERGEPLARPQLLLTPAPGAMGNEVPMAGAVNVATIANVANAVYSVLTELPGMAVGVLDVTGESLLGSAAGSLSALGVRGKRRVAYASRLPEQFKLHRRHGAKPTTRALGLATPDVANNAVWAYGAAQKVGETLFVFEAKRQPLPLPAVAAAEPVAANNELVASLVSPKRDWPFVTPVDSEAVTVDGFRQQRPTHLFNRVPFSIREDVSVPQRPGGSLVESVQEPVALVANSNALPATLADIHHAGGAVVGKSDANEGGGRLDLHVVASRESVHVVAPVGNMPPIRVETPGPTGLEAMCVEGLSQPLCGRLIQSMLEQGAGELDKLIYLKLRGMVERGAEEMDDLINLKLLALFY